MFRCSWDFEIRFTFWKLDRVSKLKDLSERADPELAEETAETPGMKESGGCLQDSISRRRCSMKWSNEPEAKEKLDDEHDMDRCCTEKLDAEFESWAAAATWARWLRGTFPL